MFMSIINMNMKTALSFIKRIAPRSGAKRGFTLIELLVVIGILAVLLAITLIAINPAKQFSQANNTKRRSDVNAILNAIDQYAADNKGALPTGITTSVLSIEKTGGADLCAALVTKYLAALPVDPLTNGGAAITDCASSYTTNYTVVQSASDNRVTVAAPGQELGEIITVTR
jgi:prepilin-type N-terminal cleavage/methylation domain-containing protein